MGSWGSKFAQQGYDVRDAADRFLVYSSAFRTLKIFAVYTGSTTIPGSGENTVTFTHNLGYYAPAIVIYNGSTTLGQNTAYFMADNNAGLDIRIFTDKVEVPVPDTFDDGYSAVGDTVYFTCYQFLDTFDSYTASIIETGTTSGAASDDYGFKIAKDGFPADTCADTDLVISSGFFTSIIHKKGTDTDGTVAHDLGYIPAFLAFKKYAGDSFLTQNDESMAINSSELAATLDVDDVLYFVIFKSKQV